MAKRRGAPRPPKSGGRPSRFRLPHALALFLVGFCLFLVDQAATTMYAQSRWASEKTARVRRSPRRASGGRKRARQTGFGFRTWGGKRKGAGRRPKDGGRPGVSHRPRPVLTRRLPVHVTLRLATEVYNLRSRRSFRTIERALRRGAERFDVRVVSFSVQGNHMHLLVEAKSRTQLAQAVKGLSVRIAKGLNKMMGRKGRVLGDRYHAHVFPP